MISSSISVCLYFPLDYAILMREYVGGGHTTIGFYWRHHPSY